VRYIKRYTSEQARRLEIRPDITGWAQVNGRNALSLEDRFQVDVWYVDHQKLTFNIRILFKTLHKVVRREGISGKGHVTMEEFLGKQR